ncbi:MAG: HAMP domain-containing histidine kinase [Acidobacteria bacterium]|nr:MAG: HAMP domain-containing histidine kinase [Acidobacteriota bacterium]
MPLGLADARQRLAYINQYRELVLGVLFILLLSSRVLGRHLPDIALVLFGVWFLLACGFVQIGVRASSERRLYWTAGLYFLAELALITAIADCLPAGFHWLALLFYVVTILHANMVLPRRLALLLAALAAAGFAFLVGVGAGLLQPPVAIVAMVALVIVGVLVFVIAGLSMAQFSRMLRRQTEALQAVNHRLQATTEELRMHRDHLEDLVRERTVDLEHATQDLRGINADLRRLNELKSSFLANVSHELRTPLTSIRSFSELLLHYPDEDPATRAEFLSIISNESDRLMRLIDEVLDLAKIEAGHLQLHPQPVALPELVHETSELFQILAMQQGLELRYALPDDLPRVWADPDRLRQVFTNLLSNAFKFTAAGRIEITAALQKGEMLITVADTGAGFPPGDAERIFDKFHQRGEAVAGKPVGAGLGLAICREICQHHGGRIWAAPRPGGGSLFHFTLPLAHVRAAATVAGA